MSATPTPTAADLHDAALDAATHADRATTDYHRAAEHMRPELVETARLELGLAQVTALVAISAGLQRLADAAERASREAARSGGRR